MRKFLIAALLLVSFSAAAQQTGFVPGLSGGPSYGPNSFTGTQTAPSFSTTGSVTVGNGSINTNSTSPFSLNSGGNGSVFSVDATTGAVTGKLDLTADQTTAGVIIGTTGSSATEAINLKPKGGAFTNIPNLNLNSGTVTISGAQGTNQFALFASPAITGSATGNVHLEQHVLQDSLAIPSGAGAFGYDFYTINAVAGFSGNRAVIQGTLNITGTSAAEPSDVFRQWTAETLTTQISANQGGTSPHSGFSAGFVYSGGDQMFAISGATNLSGVIGREIDVGCATGCSTAARTGLQIISFGNVQGGDSDRALYFSGGPASVVQFHDMIDVAGATFPVDPTGSLLTLSLPPAVTPGAYRPASLAYGIDLGGILASGADFRASGFQVSNNSVFTGAAQISTTGVTTTLDATGYVTNSVTVSSGASGYAVNDQLSDKTSGLIVTVASVNGSGMITGLNSPFRNGFYPPGSSPPATITLTDGTGRGAVASVTWTRGTTLALNPSGTTRVGSLVATGLPTSCSGQPTGTIAVVAGVFTLCP